MWILDGILAGLIAGIIMGVFSQLGYWLGIVRSHLVVVDGAFALRMIKQDESRPAVYAVGTVIHLVTSAVFGVVYFALASLLDFDPRWAVPVTVYTLALYLSMLIMALPVAGQGLAGSRIRSSVWLEQLALHVIFGLAFWWAPGII